MCVGLADVLPDLTATHGAAPGRWAIAIAGAVALAVAMGIGRFAFTPLLPMMLADGVIDLAAASWLASANYLGYLAGALFCKFQPRIWKRVPGLPRIDGPFVVRGGLVVSGLFASLMVAWLSQCWGSVWPGSAGSSPMNWFSAPPGAAPPRAARSPTA